MWPSGIRAPRPGSLREYCPRPVPARESRLFRFTFKHSIFLARVVGIVAMLFAYVWPVHVPVFPPTV